MIALTVSLIWLLAMLAAAIHLRDSPRGVGSAWRLAISFAVTLAAALWLSPQPNWVGVLVGLTAIWRLIGGPSPKAGCLLAGAVAGVAAALPVAGGLAPWLTVPITLGGLVAAFWLRPTRSGNSAARELVLVGIAVIILVLALSGDLVFGWQSAVMLNREAIAVDVASPPDWTLGIVALALAAGLLKGLWSKQ